MLLEDLCLRDILPGLLSNSPLVFLLVINKELVRLRLRRAVGVWVIQQILDPHQNLFERNGGTPTLFFVQDG
jgi:hypothetical protein